MQEIVNQKLPAWMINQSRLLACFLTIGVPFVFSVFYPNGFILALAFAGLWLCVLALVLPGIMAFVKKDLSPSSKIRAILCLFFGMGLIVMQIFIKIAF
jgi:tyrosine-specific transport protein